MSFGSAAALILNVVRRGADRFHAMRIELLGHIADAATIQLPLIKQQAVCGPPGDDQTHGVDLTAGDRHGRSIGIDAQLISHQIGIQKPWPEMQHHHARQALIAENIVQCTRGFMAGRGAGCAVLIAINQHPATGRGAGLFILSLRAR